MPMSKEEIKAALSEKITSRDAFFAILAKAGICATSRLSRDITFGYKGHVMGVSTTAISTQYFDNNAREVHIYDPWAGGRTGYTPHHLWWVVREELRLQFGVYPEPTDALTRLGMMAALSCMVPHVSHIDPAQIAYTPSCADGEADRQVRTTLGKFLKKHMITMTDEEIQALDASHRADMSSELELLTGKDNILKVYTTMSGDSGCMRYSSSHFGLPQGVHPSNVYDAPGFAAAVMRDAAGTLKARAMTWVNPADPSDKRYIRIYGDTALRRRLERNGFVCKDFRGAVLKRIDLHEHDDNRVEVVMPYIDGPGGNGNDPYNNGRYGLLLDDGVKLLSRDERDEIASAVSEQAVPSLQGTGGRMSFRKLPANWNKYTCVISGEEFTRGGERAIKVVLADCTVGEASPLKAAEAGFVTRAYKAGPDGGTMPVHPSTPTFTLDGTRYVDDAVTRRYVGYHKLDAEFYPDEQEWVHGTAFVTTAGRTIKREDRARFVTATNSVTWVHKSEVPDNAVKLWKYDSEIPFAAPEATIHVTRSGCKVVDNLHDLATLYDGKREFSRNVKASAAFGMSINMHREDSQKDIDVSQNTRLVDYIKNCGTRSDYEYGDRQARSKMTSNTTWFTVESEALVAHSSCGYAISENTMDKLRAAVAFIEAAGDTVACDGCDAEHIRWWGKSVKFLLSVFDEARATASVAAVPTAPSSTDSRFATARFSLAA